MSCKNKKNKKNTNHNMDTLLAKTVKKEAAGPNSQNNRQKDM